MSTADLYFNDLFENTGDMIHYLSLDGKILMVNPSWLNHLGYTLEEVHGKSIYNFISPDDHDIYSLYRNSSLTSRLSEDFQFSFLTREGVPLICEGNLRPFFNNEELVHTRGVFRDITFKKAQEKMRSDYLLRITQFFENAPDAVIIINENQIVSEWNRKASEIFGFTRDEVIDKPLSDIIIPVQFRKAHNLGMEHFLKTGEGPVLNKTIEVSAINKDQIEFPISLSISSVIIQGEWFFIAFISDISARKQQEIELVKKDFELEKTRQESEKSKDFLSIASHELKTPLTGIKAYLQLALRNYDRNTREQNISFIQKAEQSAEKLGQLIFTLLDISKIQAGRIIVQKTENDISQLLEDIIQSSQLLYPSHRFSFENPGSIKFNFDAARLEQVFINLISNAVKYSPNAIDVDIRLQRTANTALITVRDYGIGVKAGNHNKVFDKFYRVEDLKKNDTQGLGIGLYISSELVKQHDGHIWVENNRDGQGATFYVSLPL